MGRVGFRGRTRRYAFLLRRARSGAGVDGGIPPGDRHASFLADFLGKRHRVRDQSAYATKMRVPLLRALLERPVLGVKRPSSNARRIRGSRGRDVPIER